MFRDAGGYTLPLEKPDSTATTVIAPTRRSAPKSVGSAQDYKENAQNPEEAALAAAILNQAMVTMENANLPAYSKVSEGTLRRLSVQRNPSNEGSVQIGRSKDGKTTVLKSCFKESSQQDSTTSK